MNSATLRLLAAYKTKRGISSDYALAKAWGCSQQNLTDYRAGRRTLSDEKAIQIAEFLGIDPATALLEIQAERADRQHLDSVAATLRDAAKRLGGMAAALCCFVGFSAPSSSEAIETQIFDAPTAPAEVSQLFDDNIHYALLIPRAAAWLRQMICRIQAFDLVVVIPFPVVLITTSKSLV